MSCSSPSEAILTISSVSSIDPLMFLCTASNGGQQAAMATASVSVNGIIQTYSHAHPLIHLYLQCRPPLT